MLGGCQLISPMQPAASSPTLSAVDWGVILLYLVGVIGLGLWLGRGQRNTRDYFLGGRDLPWYTLIGCTMMLVAAVPLHLLAKSGREES